MEMHITKKYPLKIINKEFSLQMIFFCILLMLLFSCSKLPNGVPKEAVYSGDCYELHDLDEDGNLRTRLWSDAGVLTYQTTYYKSKTKTERFDEVSGQLIEIIESINP